MEHLAPDFLWFLAGWWKMRTPEQLAKANDLMTLVYCTVVLFCFSHSEEKMKLEFSIVFVSLWKPIEKVFFQFKLKICRWKISASVFMVELWLKLPQWNLPRQPRVYTRKNTLPYLSSFSSFSAFYVAIDCVNTLFFFIEKQLLISKASWMVDWGFSELWMFGFLKQRRKMKENFSSSVESCVWLTSYWTTIWKVLNSPDTFGH